MERWQWRGTPHSPKVQYHWKFTISLFSVISRTLVGGGDNPTAKKQSVYSTAPADRAKAMKRKIWNNTVEKKYTEWSCNSANTGRSRNMQIGRRFEGKCCRQAVGYKVKFATSVEGDPKAPFSIATAPRYRGGRYSIPWIAPLYSWSLPYNARRHKVPFFNSLVWLDLGLNPGLLEHWQTLYSLGQWSGWHTKLKGNMAPTKELWNTEKDLKLIQEGKRKWSMIKDVGC